MHLLTNEFYPSERKLTDKIESDVKLVENMSEMADFVYKLYLKRINDMKENMESLKKLYEKPPTEEDNEDNENDNGNDKNPAEPMETETFVETAIQNEVDVDVSQLEKD